MARADGRLVGPLTDVLQGLRDLVEADLLLAGRRRDLLEAWMLELRLSAMCWMVRSTTSDCFLPASTRFTTSSVSMTDVLMPFWMSPRMDRTLPVASLAWSARFLISFATTAKRAALLARGGGLDGGVERREDWTARRCR